MVAPVNVRLVRLSHGVATAAAAARSRNALPIIMASPNS